MTAADTDPTVLILLAVRLRSRGTAAAVAATYGTLGGDPEAATELLAVAEALGQVRRRGEVERRSLTAAGEAELAAHLAADAERAGRADLGTAYEAFLPRNRRFLVLLADVAPSPELVIRVAGLVDELEPVLAGLRARFRRFESYPARFAAALEQARDDPDWLVSPSIDSVHTIWFELHEHLLATLGRRRSDER